MFACRRLLVAVLVLTGLALANLPRASAQDDRDAAKAHFSRGTRLYEVGEYRQAIDEFKAAHLAKPDPAFLFNIGQCHRMLGETEQAVFVYKRFLAGSPNAANRAEVEARVSEMEAELAAKRKGGADMAAPAPQPPAAVSPAPKEQGPVVPLPAAAEPTSPLGVAVETTNPSELPAAASTTGSGLRTWRWVGVGVTALLAGGAVVAGLSASSRNDQLKSGCAKSRTGCSEGEIDTLKTRALLTNLLWGAAGIAAVGTTLAFVFTPQEGAVQIAWGF